MDLTVQRGPNEDTLSEGAGSVILPDIEMNMTNRREQPSSTGEASETLLGDLADGITLDTVHDDPTLEEHSYQNGNRWSTSGFSIVPADGHVEYENISEDMQNVYPPESQAHIADAQGFRRLHYSLDELVRRFNGESTFETANSTHLIAPLNSIPTEYSVSNTPVQQATVEPIPEQRMYNPLTTGRFYYSGRGGESEVCDFFEKWRFSYEMAGPKHYALGDQAKHLREMRRSSQITLRDLDGDCCDFQGINWQELGASRKEARIIRNSSFAYVPSATDDDAPMLGLRYRSMPEYMSHARMLIDTDTSFRFRQLNTKYKVPCVVGHRQLRNVIAIPSKNSVFFASKSSIHCFDPTFNTGKCVMDFSKPSLKQDIPFPRQITAITAGGGVVIAGGLEGQYAMKSLCSGGDDSFTLGLITTASYDRTTNHIHTFPDRRSGVPQAVFCSNDDKVRVLDCHTDTFIREHQFPFPVNCSSTSPDARLRLLVGDYRFPWVVDAETGKQLLQLGKQQEYGFACDWSPNGIHLATGHENGMVQVWDVRKWEDPLQIIDAEAGEARSMQFSPIGGGRPALLMAKTADLVTLIDAVTFETKQRFDFFGQIGGARFVPDGSAFFVSNMDGKFGGFMEFERVSGGEEFLESLRHRKKSGEEKVDWRRWKSLSEEFTDDEESNTSKGTSVVSSENELDDELSTTHRGSRHLRRTVDYDDLMF